MLPELIPDSIFFCLQFFIPLLFVIRALKVELTNINYRALVVATNITILISSLLTLAILLYEGFATYYSGVDYQQFAFVNAFTGPFSMFAWLTLLTRVFIPQMMWNRDFRRSISSATVWLIANWVFKIANLLLLKYVVETATQGMFYSSVNRDQGLDDYLGQALIFLMVLVPVYIFINKKNTTIYRGRSL
jgi:hypothetical protein